MTLTALLPGRYEAAWVVRPGATTEDLHEPAGADPPPACRSGGPFRPAPVGPAVPPVPGRTVRPGDVLLESRRGRRTAGGRTRHAGRADGGRRRRRGRLVHRRVPG